MLDPGSNTSHGTEKSGPEVHHNQKYSREKTIVRAVKARVTGGIDTMSCRGAAERTAILNKGFFHLRRLVISLFEINEPDRNEETG